MTQKDHPYRRDEVLAYLSHHNRMSVKDAESTYGMSKNAFWSAVRQLREQGHYITAYRSTRLSDGYCVLQTEEEWETNAHYTKANYPRLWIVWKSMRSRCQNPQHNSYKRYGGRGIQVCEEWIDHFQEFAKWSCENGYEENAPFMKCTLDRIDNNGNYEPSNCRWVDMKAQSNNRASNVNLTFGGKTMTLTQWAETINVPLPTLHKRLKAGWSIERVLTTPVRRRSDNVRGVWLEPIAK